MIPIPLIIGLSFVLIYVVVKSIKSLRADKASKMEKPTTPPAEPKGAQKAPETKKSSSLSGIFRWGIILTAITFGFLHVKSLNEALVEANRVGEVRKLITWKLLWRMEPGKYSDGGNNEMVLDVEIIRNEGKRFEIVLHGSNGSGINERLAGLTMSWIDEDLIGTWSNFRDGDGGSVYLYKSKSGSDLWTGHWLHKDGTKTHIELWKEVSKPK